MRGKVSIRFASLQVSIKSCSLHDCLGNSVGDQHAVFAETFDEKREKIGCGEAIFGCQL